MDAWVQDSVTQQDSLVKFALQAFSVLPKRTQPRAHEWTVLAAVFIKLSSQRFRLATLTTGTKCVGKDKASDDGGVVNDCHAEILARRGLKYFLLREVEEIACGATSEILEKKTTHSSCVASKEQKGMTTICPRIGVSFHLIITDPPCGEAANFSCATTNSYTDERCSVKSNRIPSDLSDAPSFESAATEKKNSNEIVNVEHQSIYGNFHGNNLKPSSGQHTQNLSCTNSDTENGIGYERNKSSQGIGTLNRLAIFRQTGAKPLAQEGREVRITDLPRLRTKSSRSDTLKERRSLSMSCSDKLALWHNCGFQGAFLSQLINQPLFFSEVIIALGSRCGASTKELALLCHTANKATIRAFHTAATLQQNSKHGLPKVAVTVAYPFEHCRERVLQRIQSLRKTEQTMTRKSTTSVNEKATLADQASKSRKNHPRTTRMSTCGLSTLWIHKPCIKVAGTRTTELHTRDMQQYGTLEVLVAAFGLRQGSKKRKRSQPTIPKTRSTVCKREMWRQFQKSARALDVATEPQNYRKAKQAATVYQHTKRKILLSPRFHGWLVADPALEQFQI